MNELPKKRSWFRFSFGIKLLLTVTTLICCSLALWSNRAIKQKDAVAEIEKLGNVFYQRPAEGKKKRSLKNSIREKLSNLLGRDYVYGVRSVAFQGSSSDALKAVGNLQSLKELKVRLKTIESFESLAYCNNLETIHVVSKDLRSLKGLSNLPNLKEASLYASIKSLEGIDNSKLETLVVGGVESGDITPLTNCKRLRYLELGNCRIEDLSPLKECKDLQMVELVCTKSATDLSAFAGKKKLNRLCLPNGNFRDLTPLAGIPVAILELDNCSLQSLQGVQDLPKLRWLCVRGNPITDFELLGDATNLDYVYFDSGGDFSEEVKNQMLESVAKAQILLPKTRFIDEQQNRQEIKRAR